MNTELLAPLVLLALIDSTSFGTLLIPLWLMLASDRPRPARMLLFLGTVAAFYLLLGIVLPGPSHEKHDHFDHLRVQNCGELGVVISSRA
jgi:hypothetical protein